MAQITDREILHQFTAETISLIKSEAVAQDRVATHAAEAGLYDRVSDTSAEIVDAAGYIEWGWEYGRRTGKRPPIAPLEIWIKAKGLLAADADEKKVRSLAFAISRKIGLLGTLLYQQGGSSDVISKSVNKDRVTTLLGSVGTKYLTEATSEILRTILK